MTWLLPCLYSIQEINYAPLSSHDTPTQELHQHFNTIQEWYAYDSGHSMRLWISEAETFIINTTANNVSIYLCHLLIKLLIYNHLYL